MKKIRRYVVSGKDGVNPSYFGIDEFTPHNHKETYDSKRELMAAVTYLHKQLGMELPMHKWGGGILSPNEYRKPWRSKK